MGGGDRETHLKLDPLSFLFMYVEYLFLSVRVHGIYSWLSHVCIKIDVGGIVAIDLVDTT